MNEHLLCDCVKRSWAVFLAFLFALGMAGACLPNTRDEQPTPEPEQPAPEPEQPSADAVPSPIVTDPNHVDCSAYADDATAVFRAVTYACADLDRCTETDPVYGFVCCECDFRWCNPDLSCVPTDTVPTDTVGNPEDPTSEPTPTPEPDSDPEADTPPPTPEPEPEPDVDNPPPTPEPDVVPEPGPVSARAESCMTCHNGSAANDYAGAGISNPHPFSGARTLACTMCHGGNANAGGKAGSHVPPPPQIGDDQKLQNDPTAYFNRLTLTGIDKFPDYTVDGITYSGLDYLQFVNPGDLRVVGSGKSCGTTGCHGGPHTESVLRGPIATETGILSGTLFAAGIANAVNGNPDDNTDWYLDTAAEYGFRAVSDPSFTEPNNQAQIGRVGQLAEFPVKSQYETGEIYDNPAYDANALATQIYADPNVGANRIVEGTPLATLFKEQIAFTCGDCHLGSAGANNRFADFRSSGCTACHMEYSPDGRSRSLDPNVNKFEPANPDAIAAPERPHIDTHQIRNVAKFVDGAFQRGISDRACAGCHQGSNRTVMQFWGIRLDQNADLTNQFQYPANPANFADTANDLRLFDPAVANNTFNGRNATQYILTEDYDGDGRDDTPPDVHYERGLGCIDCHGSVDLHNGPQKNGDAGSIQSREDQMVQIACVSCHGTIDAYAGTVPCTTYDGESADCAADGGGNPLRHVTRNNDGDFYLRSRVTGQLHYVAQTKDTVENNNKRHPMNNQLIYSPKASYAMGRINGNLEDGVGPQQANPDLNTQGFSHTDNLDCVACHAAWTNSCIGCHLKNEYDDNPNNYFFSNITGERIVVAQTNADFVYQTPVPFYLGVNSRNKITKVSPAEKAFYRYEDYNDNESRVFAFSDRLGNGNNPNEDGRGAFGALSHNQMMAHSVRGKIEGQNEGPTYCVGCHLNAESLANYPEYNDFRAILANRDYATYADQGYFELLQTEIGQNTGNQRNNPFWVHMVAGLGTGLFLFDETGCPVNPLDHNANRQYCPNGAPADNFDPNNVVYDLDRVVEENGVSNASNTHPMLDPFDAILEQKRAGGRYPLMSGPLGQRFLQKLADPNNGIVLDSWLDADGNAQGNAANFIR